jgi:hypothetical protein
MTNPERREKTIRLLLRSVYIKGQVDGREKKADMTWEDKIIKDLEALMPVMTIEEVEKVIAENMPIEFIQVIEPFARARIYKDLASKLIGREGV